MSEYAGLHAVAFADPVRDVVGDDGGLVFGSDPFDGGLQEDGSGGSVDVVVAVDEYGFAGTDCVLDTGYCQVHAEHEHGIDEVIDGGVEKGVGGYRVRDASRNEEACYGVWAVEVLRKARHCGGIDGCELSIVAAQRGRRTSFVYSSLSRLSTTMPPRSETVSIRFWKLSYQSVATSKMNMTPWYAKPSWR